MLERVGKCISVQMYEWTCKKYNADCVCVCAIIQSFCMTVSVSFFQGISLFFVLSVSVSFFQGISLLFVLCAVK